MNLTEPFLGTEAIAAGLVTRRTLRSRYVKMQRAHDIDRNVELAEFGWRIVHVGADMLRNRPWLVVRRGCDALRANGCPWVDSSGITARYSWIVLGP